MEAAMVQRISRCEHEYAGVKLEAGDKFDVEPKHVGLLLLLGRIEPEEGEPGYTPPMDRPVSVRVRKNGARK